MRVLVDVDQVCADLHTPWLERYRKFSGHEFYSEHLTKWEIDELVLPGWEKAIYGLLTPNLYDQVRPIPLAREAIETLRDHDNEVVFVSSCHKHEHAIRKQRWLRDWGFAGDDGELLFIATSAKHEVSGDVLIDDSLANIESFPGHRVLFDAPYNQAPHVWSGAYRARGWLSAMACLNMIRQNLENPHTL
jgi:5'(3')-deoxyribonucleotidase